ncbi:large subunit terminase [Caudoviricetes sp.]|nr:large subunit terminase [Caudoviricetes sp.]
MSNPLVDYLQYTAQHSFYCFRQLINKDFITGEFPKALSNDFQIFWKEYKAGLRPKVTIATPPQHGKSTAMVEFFAWVLGHESKTRIIYASFSDRLGKRASRDLKRILSSPRYKLVFPNVQLTGQQTMEFFEVNEKGCFRQTTVNGSITGEGLDIGGIDDIIKGRNKANSITTRETTWRWLTDDYMSRFSDHGGMILTATRWHLDDPSGRLAAHEPSLKTLKYPAIKDGKALFPELKSLDFLLQAKARMLPSSWESLYQQNPILDDGDKFKPHKITVIDTLPDIKKWCRGWDLAATAGGGDATAGAKLGITHDGKYVIADVISIYEGPDEVENAIKAMASQDGRQCIIRIPQDPGQAGKAQALRLGRMLAGYNVIFTVPRGTKANRADGFAAQVNIGNVSMLRAKWNASLIDKMQAFTGASGEQDDEIDALSDAFDQLTLPGKDGPWAMDFKGI